MFRTPHLTMWELPIAGLSPPPTPDIRVFFVLIEIRSILFEISIYKLCHSSLLGCRIRQLQFYEGLRPPSNDCRGYDTKPSHDEAFVLELWGIWSTSSLPLLLVPLWPEIPVKVLSIGQIQLFNHLLYLKPFDCAKKRLMLNWSNNISIT